MKAILMAIHPKWCEKIFNGSKTIEVRKTFPNLKMPFKVYVYQTRNGMNNCKNCNRTNICYTYSFSGKVVGEWVCDKTIDLPCETTQPNWLKEKTCLSDNEYMSYLGHKEGKGWYIKEPKLYDKPKELSEFRKPCVDKYEYCQGCKHGLITIPPDEEEYALYHGGYYEFFNTVCLNTVSRPPQSWVYVNAEID